MSYQHEQPWTSTGSGGSSTGSKTRRHSKEDAISEREFEILLQATREIKDRFQFETRFCLFAAAKLGMRAGEIAHISTDWIDWSTRMIDIPEHDTCTQGVDGDVCGYCRTRAKERVRTNNLSLPEAKQALRDEFGDDLEGEALDSMARTRCEETNISFRQALGERWNPKTINSARSIPFDFDVRTEMCIEEFADRHDRFPSSKATINRRIDRVAEASGLENRIYPHALRATAASLHASRGISPYALMSIMGWEDITTARSYIQSSDETAAKEIRSKYR